MATFDANLALDMEAFIAESSLDTFFEDAEAITKTGTQFVLRDIADGLTETLTLGGTFGNYVGDYPTSGTVTAIDYSITGGASFSITNASISVADFTAFVTANDISGLFEAVLGQDDTLLGSNDDDVLFGFDGDDVMNGRAGVDVIYGGEGSDEIDGGSSGDTMAGGLGNDIYRVDHVGDNVVEGIDEGTDRVLSSVDYDLTGRNVEILTLLDANPLKGTGDHLSQTMHGNSGNNVLKGMGGDDVLNGGDGDDTLDGGTGIDTLAGGAGNDTIISGAGADILLLGGLGDDKFYLDDAGDVVVEAAGAGNDRIFASSSYAMAAGVHVEILSTTNNAGTDAINLSGNELVNSLAGNAGNNVLNGGAGADTLNGLGGNDMLYVDDAGDVVIEYAGGGSDRVFASTSYALAAGVHVEILSTTNNAGTEAIHLVGNELVNSIAGNNGANVLYGGAGADTLNGLGGDDMLYVDNAGDVIVEYAGGGSDRVFASVSYTLGAAAQVEILSTTNEAGTGAINLTGNGLANSIIGNAGNNVLNGGAGADTLNGLGGNDMFYVDGFGDVVIEAAGGGSDRIFASASYAMGAGVHVEILSTTNNAGTAAINLAGNELVNSIAGNAGSNVLDGRGGSDTLNGLGGADTFRFATALGAGNIDTVVGYAVADDKIEIDNAVFTGLAAGALAAGAFNTGAAATQADDRIIYNSATGALLFDADGNGAGAAVQFATLSAGLAMTAGEFVVI